MRMAEVRLHTWRLPVSISKTKGKIKEGVSWTFDTPSFYLLEESLLLQGIEEADAHGFAILLGISDIGENLG